MLHRIAVLLLLVCAVQSLGQDVGKGTITLGMINGRAWQSLSESAKLGYLVGAFEGLTAAAVRADLGTRDNRVYKLRSAWWPQNPRKEEVMEALNRFYAEPENLPVVVIDAITVVVARARGDEAESVEKLVATLRRMAAADRK